MKTYLVTFGNIFEHVTFMKNPKQYFGIKKSNAFDVKVYNSRFCEIHTTRGNSLFYEKLKQDFPHIKIVLKLQIGPKTNYINL